MQQNKSKRTLLIFVNSYAPKMETFIYNHIKKMSEVSEFEITVLCHEFPNKKFTIDPSLKIIETGIPNIKKRIFNSLKLLVFNPIFFFRLLFFGQNSENLSLFSLALQLKNKKFDVIHAHFGQNGKLISELIAANVIQSRLITQFHGLDITSEKCREPHYYKILKGRIAKAFVNSEYSKNKLLELGFSNDKTVKIPVGTNAQLFLNRRKEVEERTVFTITFVGRLIELKGAQLLPEIASEMIRQGYSDFHINIVGEGNLKEKIAELSQNLSDKIALLGYRTPSEIKTILTDTDVVVYPGIRDAAGREETQGLIIQEAMFMGIPVVASAIGGVAESIIDGESGFVCRAGDLVQFAQQLIFLAHAPQLRKSMGENALELAKNKYDLDLMIQKTIKIYKEV